MIRLSTHTWVPARHRLLLTTMVSTWCLGILITGPAAAALVAPLITSLCRELEQIETEVTIVDEIREQRNNGAKGRGCKIAML